MARLKMITLDVLKPRLPGILDFATRIADVAADYHVGIEVVEMDENTESTLITVRGDALDLQRIEGVINEFGGSVHSVDKVEVSGEPPNDQ
jgi:hypothetical protein